MSLSRFSNDVAGAALRPCHAGRTAEGGSDSNGGEDNLLGSGGRDAALGRGGGRDCDRCRIDRWGEVEQ